MGKVKPLMLNALPERFACEIVTLAVPMLVIVSVMFPVRPTWTLPNPTVVGFPLKLPLLVAVADSAIERLWLPAVNVKEPFCEPAAVGLNINCNGALCPAAMVNGNEGELMLKPVPEIVGWATDTLPDVPFTMLSFSVTLWPTATDPKLRLVLDTLREPLGGGVPPVEPPCTA